VCLSEVKRCRPFFIVLIGDRYGWVPPRERARAALQEAGFEASFEGKSITALEMDFALLGDPSQPARSRLYVRQLDYSGMDERTAVIFSDARAAQSPLLSDEDRALAAARAKALHELKARLRSDHPFFGNSN
jgi:hypothetical protein